LLKKDFINVPTEKRGKEPGAVREFCPDVLVQKQKGHPIKKTGYP
jgi:hypothetical protein